MEVARGDALFIPAGVSHKRIECTKDFSGVGAYALDIDYDIQRGKKIPEKENIHSLPIPTIDPIFESKGPLMKYWKQ